ncbi:MAG: response regulator [Spirulinaceae cyanobacterium SM2_1_0]|nr:response regulator [Spirulinaceae cyanobacterium SM2_1_0]
MISSPSTQRARILVVDHRPLARSLTVDILCAEGYQVLEADNGFDALQQAVKELPDAILLDLFLPGLDGLSVCRRLKSQANTQSIPVIFVTVAENRESRLASFAAGGADFLRKPLDRLELMTRLRSLIAQKRLNDDLQRTKQVLYSIAQALAERYSERSNSRLEDRIALTEAFGTYLGLPETDIRALVDTTLLHDLGTLTIPDAVLLKTEPLTVPERDLIRQHVLIGEQICQPLRDLQSILPILRHHHERWDGSGYPDGIAGSTIPWLAQVFQIVDIYDALVSERPHKQPLSPAEALAVLDVEATRGWRNPKLVEQFRIFIRQQQLEAAIQPDA